jgi:hypothetical protein
MSHRKLLAGVAVIAALGAGATIGAFLGVPTLSGAQTPTPTSSASPKPGKGPFAPGLGLRTALQGGQSIAALAKSKNVDPQKIINDLVADATTRIDAAVSSGKITAAQGTKIKANLTTAIGAFVNGTLKGMGGFRHGFRGPFPGPGGPGKGGHRPTATATPASI